MIERILTGDQAIAHGALEADVRVVTGYPGSPSTKALASILELSRDDTERHIEWSINEKVAFEIALGASLGGDRSMVCLKSVGMNIAVDPIMTANLTGVNAGLVILLGDDPGAWLSQNEQDTRRLVDFMELPLMEPSSPQEGKDMIAAAFDISEEFQTVVIVREIRSFSTAEAPVELTENPIDRGSKGFVREKNRWVSTTFNVLENHKKLHDKLEQLERRFESSPFNKIVGTNARQFVIAAGFTYSKLVDALGPEPDGFAVFKLGTVNPLPRDMVTNFLSGAKRVVVLEDNEPYVESKIKAIAYDADLNVQVLGKTTGHVPREGELSKEDITRTINAEYGTLRNKGDACVAPTSNIQHPASSIQHPASSTQHPASSTQHPVSSETKRSFCDGCPYTPTFQALSQVIEELGEEPVVIAEPGCAVRLNAPPFEMLDVKYSMGSAIGIASGLARARAQIKPIAVCGDSSFFHTGVTGLMNMAENRANIFIMVLDNSVTALTGYQPHPGTGRDARGRETQAVEIAEIARACHVPFVTVVDPDDTEAMRLAFRRGLTSDELSLVVVRKPCPLAL
jgi:indolepyruvate ferredoxin oxidoreductase alpha subunit